MAVTTHEELKQLSSEELKELIRAAREQLKVKRVPPSLKKRREESLKRSVHWTLVALKKMYESGDVTPEDEARIRNLLAPLHAQDLRSVAMSIQFEERRGRAAAEARKRRKAQSAAAA